MSAARAILLCFDISDRANFEELKNDVLPLLINTSRCRIWKLVGLKGDLEHAVSKEEIDELCKSR